MGKIYKMSWDGQPYFRWKKMHKGTMHRVSCDDLGLPKTKWTKQDSYLLANAWWESKRGTLTVCSPIDQKIEWAKINAPEEVEALEFEKAQEPGFNLEASTARDYLESFEGIVLPENATLDTILGDGKVWQERFSRQAAIPKESTLSTLLDQFKVLVGRNQKPKSYREIIGIVDMLKEFAPALTSKMDVKTINESTVSAVFHQISSATWCQNTKKKRWGLFKRFVNFCFEQNLLTLPRNLNSSLFSFKVSPKAVVAVPIEVVKEELAKLPPRLRCFALLGVQCGMTQADIGALTHDMVRGGYLTRKRVKTDKHENVPTVSYKLWPETLALMEQYKSEGQWYFQSESGTQLVVSYVGDDGKVKEKDLIRLAWTNAKCGLLLKQFRSIGATLLDSHREYGRQSTLFLGHSPKSLKDKHYSSYGQDVFDEALAWMRSQIYG